MTNTGTILFDTVEELIAQGISVIPVVLKTKAPLVPWKKYQSLGMTIEEARPMFAGLNEEHGIGLVCGEVSGGLELIDCDNKTGDGAEIFRDFIETPEVSSIIRRYSLPYEKTPSGGRHLWYRCKKIDVNKKLAQRAIEEDGHRKIVTIFETRGEGGYGICAPSKNYVIMYGSLGAIPVIEAGDREILMEYAQSFGMILPAMTPAPTTINHDTNRVGDVYSDDLANSAEVLNLLINAGWRECRKDKENIYLRRPGKENGVSATFNGSVLYVFSTNATPFEGGKGYSLFAVFALLKHNGDFSAAAKELIARGPGTSIEPQIQEERQDTFIVAYVDQHHILKYRIKYDRFIATLEANGYRRYSIQNDVQIVRLMNNIVEEVFLHDIIDFALSLIHDPDARDCLIKNEKNLFTLNKMKCLQKLPDDFNLDTADCCWMYFKNVAVRLTRGQETYDCFDYADLPKPVWKSKIMDREFDSAYCSAGGSEIEKVIWNVSGHDEARRQVAISAIGYTIHAYKDQSMAKAIVFTDERIPDHDEDANGGTGKSLIAKFIKMYTKTAQISGKTADFNSPFFFQQVDHSTGLILADDVSPKFAFRNLFSMITGDLIVEKKNKEPFTIPFERAPKFLITTNYTIQGADNSTERRKLEIPFAPYYNASFSPRDEFGHDLMSEWTPEQQMREDAYMLEMIQFYLDHGLLSNKKIQTTTCIRQCISETNREFAEFMMDEIEGLHIQHNVDFDRNECFKRYKRMNEDAVDMKLQTFTKWLSKFGTIFGLKHTHRRVHGVNKTRFKGNLIKVFDQYRIMTNDEVDVDENSPLN